MATMFRSLPTDVMDNVSAYWGMKINHEQKLKAMKNFLKSTHKIRKTFTSLRTS